MKTVILGGSGYIGGELARILIDHPRINLVQVTSKRLADLPLDVVHPNLRGRTELRFTNHNEISECDVLFTALPHGRFRALFAEIPMPKIVLLDLSADFRLKEASAYDKIYGSAHEHPNWLEKFQSGIPELNRENLTQASRIAIPGCMANAAILALYPLASQGLIKGRVNIDALTGSSGSGAQSSPASHHPERSGAVRVFKANGHRHEEEIRQACQVEIHMSAVGIESVRGIQTICHVEFNTELTNRDLWQIYRKQYTGEPFIRIVKEKRGVYRLPEPKILCGTNYCDIGFDVSQDGHSGVIISAIDNLVKGGAGNAIQCLNISQGFDERTGLTFPGLHPI